MELYFQRDAHQDSRIDTIQRKLLMLTDGLVQQQQIQNSRINTIQRNLRTVASDYLQQLPHIKGKVDIIEHQQRQQTKLEIFRNTLNDIAAAAAATRDVMDNTTTLGTHTLLFLGLQGW